MEIRSENNLQGLNAFKTNPKALYTFHKIS